MYSKKEKIFEPRYAGEIVASDAATPRKANRALMLAKRQVTQQRLQLKSLRMKNIRLKTKGQIPP